MLFNSVDFVVFLFVVLAAYYLLPFRWQNRMLLLASYIFYGWWDERFLFLIVLSTCIDYWAGLLIDRGRLNVRQRVGPSVVLLLAAVVFLAIGWRDGQTATPGLSYVGGRTGADGSTLDLSQYGGWGYCLATAIGLAVLQWLVTIVMRWPESKRRKAVLAASVLANLGVLGFFKYFNFFAESTTEALQQLGLRVNPVTLNVILPVGISFYTFQTMSYSLDIYRRQMRATQNFFDFALFVSFFPQLVAGPIERAATLLPQVEKPRPFAWESISEGTFLIAFGLFKKVAIADGVAASVDSVFHSVTTPSAPDVALASFLFAVQIYGDFSGYSHIARGTAKLMGFDLMLNFHVPYFARSPREFWRRWHISLSTWMRDYVYFVLGGSRGSRWHAYRNTMATMVLSGLWHGAGWTFVLWGAWHGLILCLQRAGSEVQSALRWPSADRRRSAVWHGFCILLFFMVTCYGMMIFRARSVGQVAQFTSILLTSWHDLSLSISRPTLAALLGLPLLFLYDAAQFVTDDPHWYRILPPEICGLSYSCVVFVLLLGLSNAPAQFIYFQF